MSARIPTSRPGMELAPRQKEILILVGKGMTNLEICELTGLSYYTVTSHIRDILLRLDVSNRVEAAVWACKEGWL